MYTVREVMRMYNILVCDDDKEIVEAIEIYLSQEGYHILKAYDGMEAIKILESEEVNLLILDVMMPRLDGIRTTLKIREKNSIPIIILSAKSEDADKILGLNVGADDYVTKPFSPLELVARVKSQLLPRKRSVLRRAHVLRRKCSVSESCPAQHFCFRNSAGCIGCVDCHDGRAQAGRQQSASYGI